MRVFSFLLLCNVTFILVYIVSTIDANFWAICRLLLNFILERNGEVVLCSTESSLVECRIMNSNNNDNNISNFI